MRKERFNEPVLETVKTERLVEPVIVLSLGKYPASIEPIKYVSCDDYEKSGVPQADFYRNRGIALARFLYSSTPGGFAAALIEELNILRKENDDKSKVQ